MIHILNAFLNFCGENNNEFLCISLIIYYIVTIIMVQGALKKWRGFRYWQQIIIKPF